MNRIDTLVNRVRNKLTVAEFLAALARATLVVALLVLAYVLLRQFTLMTVPRELAWLSALCGGAVLYAGVTAALKRPAAMPAAVAIDDRLGLKEKFSTALHARGATDPFNRAAVLDAEQAAQSSALTADLSKKFPLSYPKAFTPAAAIAVVCAALILFVQPRNLFASDDPQTPTPKKEDQKAQEQAQKVVKQAIAAIDMAPKSVAEKESIKIAKAELRELSTSKNVDPAAANRKALSALQDVKDALKQQVEKNQKFADAKDNLKSLEKLQPDKGDNGPVADAQRELAKGNFDGAVGKLDEAVKKFDAMDDAQKQQSAKQMEKMAQQLQKMANDPQQQQKMQQQLQQMGMNQQQAQQAMKAMQQAAQGNQQAQQQLQQMAQQAMKGMNNGQGATQAQQQQVQQMLQQLQGQANNQQQAQQLQQAAQGMAQAMQQAAAQQGQQGQKGQQGQQGQQAQQGGQQGQQGQQAGGQQPGQQPGQQGQQGQQAQSGQPSQQGQSGQQGGQQPGGQQNPQSLAAAQQQMKDQLQQMQAAAQDAQQVAAAQQAAQDAAGQAQQGMNGDQPGQGEGEGQGPFAAGDPGQNQGNGQGGPGLGRGGNVGVTEAPFTVKREVSKSKDIESGRIIAATLIKSEALRGESKAALQDVARAALQDQTDEVDNERVGRAAQGVVRDYFGSLAEEK
ncbi:MAG TPA: hypothetical protein VF624_00955 [Tepidisphaeraceae bacterium]